MRDSNVLVFTGARGSGKTMSAVVQCIVDMVVYGQTIVSNVPISFLFKDDDGSKPKLYQSLPLSIDDVVKLDETIKNCVILWDEMPLWLYSRQSNALLNRLAGLILTLLRKRSMSLYVTSQFLKLIDSNVRIQMDCEVRCSDMSYKWHNLRRGELIQQTILDVSGRFTGATYEESKRSYERLLHASDFWGVFDSYASFDIYDAQTKYRLAGKVKEIVPGDVEDAYTPDLLEQVKREIADIPPARYEASELQNYIKNALGVNLDNRALGRLFKAAGLKYSKSTKGYYYEVKDTQNI